MEFLADYRMSYEQVPDKWRANEGPMLYDYDTSQTTIDQIAGKILKSNNLKMNSCCPAISISPNSLRMFNKTTLFLEQYEVLVR
jgi:hypothetical protein